MTDEPQFSPDAAYTCAVDLKRATYEDPTKRDEWLTEFREFTPELVLMPPVALFEEWTFINYDARPNITYHTEPDPGWTHARLEVTARTLTEGT